MIPQVRSVSQTQHTHRMSTLQAISSHVNGLNTKIAHSQSRGAQIRQALQAAPSDMSSRLDVLNKLLYKM